MGEWFRIILWVGQGGGGKTTGMVRDMERELDYGTQYTQGYCNIEVRHPKVKKVSFADFKDIRAPLVKGKPTALLCLDQLHKYMDARQSMSPRNIYMGNIVIESRQHGLDLRGTTWARSSIDLRARTFNELQILSERTSRGFQYTYLDTNNGKVRTMPIMPYAKCEKYWMLFDMDELVEDVNPKWDPRTGSDPAVKKQKVLAR